MVGSDSIHCDSDTKYGLLIGACGAVQGKGRRGMDRYFPASKTP